MLTPEEKIMDSVMFDRLMLRYGFKPTENGSYKYAQGSIDNYVKIIVHQPTFKENTDYDFDVETLVAFVEYETYCECDSWKLYEHTTKNLYMDSYMLEKFFNSIGIKAQFEDTFEKVMEYLMMNISNY